MTPKVLVFMLVLLSDHLSPSGMLAFLSLEPCKRVREHFRGWGLDPKVQSPTVAPRGRGLKPTVRTRVKKKKIVCNLREAPEEKRLPNRRLQQSFLVVHVSDSDCVAWTADSSFLPLLVLLSPAYIRGGGG